MQAIDHINWEKVQGLLPVITQEYQTNEILMLAYMNKEALELTIQTQQAHYFSRTKNRIWKKGESSGHIQDIKEILLDCDQDTLLLKVKQIGVACHTGRKSCFFTPINIEQTSSIQEETLSPIVNTTAHYGVLDNLYHTIQEKKHDDPNLSYTAKLLQGKQNSLLKKIVEEAGEFTFAMKDKNKEEIVYEAADMVYHTMVALASENIDPDQIKQELKRRFAFSGIEEKKSRS